MARTFFGGGSEINDLLAYTEPGSVTTGFSVVATPAPSQGTYRFKATGTTAAVLITHSALGNLDNVPSLTYRWQSQRDFRLEGTLNAAQEVRFAQFQTSGPNLLRFYWVYVSSTTYKLRIKNNVDTTLGTTTSTYTAGGSPEDIDIRLQTDGTTLKLWVNGTLEISVASALTLA